MRPWEKIAALARSLGKHSDPDWAPTDEQMRQAGFVLREIGAQESTSDEPLKVWTEPDVVVH